ncbi:replication initiation factor [Trinickia terrae]|uniref:Replication initiation factor n=1 Tax=Trinickia terrae TaxID=2571161 RepID=A0A4U1HBT2_9BURK|nr:replication initiation factor domain-containing protein [Trinickia terrae]TKC77253.1 replication initiation factor [Trinickia terrae]
MVEFDAYTATMRGVDVGDVISLLFESRKAGWDMRQGRGHHGFESRVGLRDETGSEAAAVAWGGEHGDLVMVEVKGLPSREVVPAIRKRYPEHAVTRVDSAYDLDKPGAWEDLLREVVDVKDQFRLWGEKRGDWDRPEDGRTMYLGAPTSVVRTRLYEKGKQKEYRGLGHPDWVRLEVQIRPKKEAREVYNGLEPLEVWGASPFTRELAARVLKRELNPFPAGTVRRRTSDEAALRHMCYQYAPHLLRLAADVGSWDCVGLTLRDMIARVRRSEE